MQPSINRIKASDGSGNASVATVQNTRSPGATTIQVDTVAGIPAEFYGSMGTPHTFTDPVTGETITVISEASAVDFAGHVDGSNLEIDEIADGYVDDGSAVGDIVVIRPTTQWGDNVADVLEESHNDDGSFKDDSISDHDMFTTDLDPVQRMLDMAFNFVASGCVWTGDAYGSTRLASMTAGVVYIGGKRLTVAAVTGRTFTASKDTYIDVKDNGDGTALIIYTEVNNNAASPSSLSNGDTFADATHIRLGIIVTGASNIAAVGSINQGQENKVLPIASSVAYTTTDSLGYLICPRDPSRKLLGYRQITSSFGSTSGSAVQVTGLSCPVRVPDGRRVKITFKSLRIDGNADDRFVNNSIWLGAVGSGTQLMEVANRVRQANTGTHMTTQAIHTPNTSSVTYNIGQSVETPMTGTTQAAANAPAAIMVELE